MKSNWAKIVGQEIPSNLRCPIDKKCGKQKSRGKLKCSKSLDYEEKKQIIAKCNRTIKKGSAKKNSLDEFQGSLKFPGETNYSSSYFFGDKDSQ